MSHIDELVLDYVSGTLDETANRDVDRHLSTCAACRAVVAETEEELATLTLTLLPIRPAPALRDRVLTSARHSIADEVGRFFDLSAADARDLLDRVDVPESWEDGVFGATLMHLTGGDSLMSAGADCGFIRIPGGVTFPVHSHLGEERNFIVQGLMIDDTGRVYRRGDVINYPAGSSHTFRAAEGADLIYATVMWNGIEVGGVEISINRA